MNILGYVKTYREYLKTPKGKYDAKDYAKAAICFFATMLLVLTVVAKG
ncbi:MAG: hypothetical protein IKN43_10435 [Selenomonadaceae bacterium]|nr:hypothetical protein [Selenomonadaceae bacterium]